MDVGDFLLGQSFFYALRSGKVRSMKQNNQNYDLYQEYESITK